VIVCTFTTIVPQCNGNESFNLYVEYFFPLLMPRILPDCIYEQHSGCLIFIFIIRNRNCLPLARTCSHPLGKEQSGTNNPETLATLGTQEKGRRENTVKHRNKKKTDEQHGSHHKTQGVTTGSREG
jgi:hypothetical protein